jgi:hypothetical protein
MAEIVRDSKGREYMRWPREGESMGAYREYIKRLLVEYGEIAPTGHLRGVIDALRQIADADPVDMALDPGWAARIARAALAREE